ncbi:MAG: ABC transporter substrate-binding protein [Thermodesulfobacteriota bacterium]
MRTGKVKLVSIVLVTALIAMLVGGCDTEDKMPSPNRITVTDMAGRQVSVNVPVKKVVLCFDRHLPTFAAVAGEGFLEKIAGWGKITPMSDQNIYKEYKQKNPGIVEAIPDVGSHAKGTFSVEKVISLKPDVVIFPLWMLIDKYEGIAEDIARMEQAGIPTVIVDYWKKPFENTIPSTLLLGALLGKEKRAQEIADFYQKRVDEVVSRLQKIKKPKPKGYLEGISKRSSQYGWTCGYAGWGVIVAKAGGINIAEDIIKERGAIAPEYLLKINPDFIIISSFGGSWCETHSSMKSGIHETPESSMRLFLKAVTERPGWNTLNAVKNGRVYGIFDSSYLIYNNIYTFAVIQTVAKWLHPDEFKNLDPETDLREFDKKFQPMGYSGIWMIGVQD